MSHSHWKQKNKYMENALYQHEYLVNHATLLTKTLIAEELLYNVFVEEIIALIN